MERYVKYLIFIHRNLTSQKVITTTLYIEKDYKILLIRNKKNILFQTKKKHKKNKNKNIKT
jgi:hypothetical protein